MLEDDEREREREREREVNIIMLAEEKAGGGRCATTTRSLTGGWQLHFEGRGRRGGYGMGRRSARYAAPLDVEQLDG
jgi:hypothetical protein